ncbi:ATP-binding cassette domain-containing protein [Salinibacterium sp. SYSU T00001]|uniref:ABC transporter ATP-binding protein n=1 Tax=Homoserinimonas sedimenticola TaxID=2986805 RepID=UPI00223667C6|nr:ATP-binding cassette domain-containing protein [Salinibacterium sedimenticola]MCW4385584.1 ATP-binding cassette domain-containing protein [Salinibacterium sedimenticola]
MLELDSVSRSFGERRVLHDVSFTVARGRMTGFVGGNGAGKTTTMRVMMGVLAPDSGRVTLDGSPISTQARTRFGYMPEERGLYPKMKVAEQITYLGRLHGLSTERAKANTDALLERLGLGERSGDTVESLSLGNQQRAQIAAALVHEPEVLILDEPFSGLDPLAVEVVLGVLKDHAAKGAPVLFSSHQLDIVERLCDDLVVIADGTIRASGSREGLREQHSGNRHELQVAGDLGWLRDEPGVEVLEFDGGYAVFDCDSQETTQRVLRSAIAAGPVLAFTPKHPSLSQIFKEVIQ